MARRQAVPQLLKKLQLAHGKVTVESTPRRLAVMVASVQAKQDDVEERVRGPPAKVRHVACHVPRGFHVIQLQPLNCLPSLCL